MKQLLQRHGPLAAAIAFYLGLVLFLFHKCASLTGGQFIYPLDDAYIHLAHGRNLGLHGVWGATSHEFSSSTSSLLWTILLAATCRLAGVYDLAPLVLNALAGLALLAALHAWLRARVRNPFVELMLLAFFVLIVPMPLLTIIGMEHTLQVLLTVVFISRYQAALGREPLRPRQLLALGLLAALLVMSRYEELFVIAWAGFFLIALRRWRAGLALWAAAWVPVLVYGLFSIAHGGWLLPNTLLLKGNVPGHGVGGILATLQHSFVVLQINLPVYVLLLLAAAAWCVNNSRRWVDQTENNILLLLFIGTAALHTLLAQFGFLFRYEAYLIALGFMALVNFLFTFPFNLAGAPLPQRVWTWSAAACLGWLILLPFWPRAFHSLRDAPTASRNIFSQQYQVAGFIKRFFPGQPVAVNDIGLVSYLSDPPLFDMWGLANQAVANAKRHGDYDMEKIDTLTRARGIQLAIVYDPWFTGKIPKSWIKLATWKISDNYICAFDTVSIYAVDPKLASRLLEDLKAFGEQLPPSVTQRSPYLSR